MLKINIRQYTKNNFQFTHDLHRENMIGYIYKYWGGWNSDIYRRDIRPKITWIIEIEGESVGFFVMNYKKKAYLKNLEISSCFQNKGIGSQVLQHRENESIKKRYDY